MSKYVHGYSDTEARRLADQANTLADLLHSGFSFSPGSHVLEAGCGTGAQTIQLAQKHPHVHFFSFDSSEKSLEIARQKAAKQNLHNVRFEATDIYSLPYSDASFDYVFVCFLLEHLNDPRRALQGLRKTLKDGGDIIAIEGDHGSYNCHPRSAAADHVVQCLIDAQAHKKGDSLIGRRLYPLLAEAGFKEVKVLPRMVYVDASKPELVEGFTKKTFIAMIEGVKEEALSLGLSNEHSWNQGIADLYRTTREDGTFCYTFFQATGRK
jgi:ubiquinone/menaquinone biosynthesis C-methylase UbiE